MARPKKNAPEGRTATGRFAPGHSGNPGGMPAGASDVRALAREFTTEAIETLVKVMRKGSNRDRRDAAVALLDRGWGKPAHTVIVEKPTDTMSTDELLAEIEQLTALVRTKGNA